RGSLIRSNYIQRLKDDGETDEYIAEADTQEEIGEIVVSMTTPGETSKVPDLGEQTAEAVARGKAIYIKQGCKSCHGDTGKGDGQQKMVDNEGLPTSPRDLTKGIFKGGHDPASVYRRVAYGMPGTPMPSSKNLDSKQIADLVHFSLSLSNEAARESVILKRERIVANQVAAVPVALDATAWSEAPSVGIRMTPLWWRDDADPGLKVQALHDGESVALRLVWSDPNANEHAAKTESFEDALAVELYRGDSEPFIGMGGKGAAVDVWMWDADRQGSPTAIEEIYPNIVTDRFPFSEVVASAEGKRPAALTANQPKISLPAVASGNQIVPVEGPSGATSLTVGGPGSVTFRLPTSQLVKARGEWKDGRWTVVMTRVLATMSESDGISLKPGDRVSVAFAVWEGSMRDRDGKKVISVWQDLELGKAK
ncbi:MAG: ethylbenzene dehydrogenase-related protein, partial [Planctomycetales bacterium]